jgi:hypothetical protein
LFDAEQATAKPKAASNKRDARRSTSKGELKKNGLRMASSCPLPLGTMPRRRASQQRIRL